MKAAQLEAKSIRQLAALAREAGIRVKRRATKADLISAIRAARAKPPRKSSEPRDLPSSYNRSRLVLMEVEPRLLHAYWEVTPSDFKAAMERLGTWRRFAPWILRFYDVTYTHFDGTNAHSFFDVPVDIAPGNWYVHLWEGDKTYLAEIGPRAPNGRFVAVCRSGPATLPRTGPSHRYDPQWLKVEAGRAVLVEEPSSVNEPAPAPSAEDVAPIGSAPPMPWESRPAAPPTSDHNLEELQPLTHSMEVPALSASFAIGEGEGSGIDVSQPVEAEPASVDCRVDLSPQPESSFELGSDGILFPFTQTSVIERPSADPALSGTVKAGRDGMLDARWIESAQSGRFILRNPAEAAPSGKRK